MKVTLKYDSIFHDVRQLTYRFGEHRYAQDGTQSEAKDTAQLGDNDSDKQLVKRYCHTGVAKLRMILKDHITLLFLDANDELTNANQWEFVIKDEIGDSQALADLMHWFIVRYAMYEWARAFAPNEASLCKEDMEEIKDELDELLLLSSWPKKTRREVWEDVSEISIVV